MNSSTGKRGRTRTAGLPPDEHLGRNRVGLSRTVQATVYEKTTMTVQRCHEIVQVTYSGFCT